MKKIKNLLIFNLFLISSLISQSNYSLSFDGNNDFVDINNNLNGSYDEFTIMGWVKVVMEIIMIIFLMLDETKMVKELLLV